MPRKSDGIRKREGRSKFEGSYYDADGKRHWVSLSEDRATSKRMRAELIRRVDLERAGLLDGTKQEISLEDLSSRYFEALGLTVSDRHLLNVKQSIRKALSIVSASSVKELRSWMIDDLQRARIAEGVSARTVNKCVAHLVAMLKWAASRSIIARNPIEAVTPLPEAKARVKTRRRLTREEIAALLSATDAEDAALASKSRVPQAAMWRLLLGTGFRWSEATSLRWRDLAFAGEHWRLTVRAQNSKSGAQRTNPIDPDLSAELLALRASHGSVVGRLPDDDAFILLTPEGIPWGGRPSDNARRLLFRHLALAKLPRKFPDGTSIDIHALRHTYCTLLCEAGVDAWTAMTLMGHQDIRTTQSIYADVERRVTAKDAAISQMSSLIRFSRASATIEPPKDVPGCAK